MTPDSYVYDAGALVAAEREDKLSWALHRTALESSAQVIVPTPVVAQAWRRPQQARLAMLLKSSDIWPLDDGLARRVGRLCGAAKTTDVVDATVAVLAADLHATVLTSDPDDITHLLDELNALNRVEIVDV